MTDGIHFKNLDIVTQGWLMYLRIAGPLYCRRQIFFQEAHHSTYISLCAAISGQRTVLVKAVLQSEMALDALTAAVGELVPH